MRDPNNQPQVVKNFRICVTKVVPGASPQPSGSALSPGQRRRLNQVVLSCQPLEGALSTAVAAGDYDLSFNGNFCDVVVPVLSHQ